MNRESKLIIVAVLCVAVLGLTVAYSALSASLKINGTGSVTAGTWDVGFTGDSASGTVGGTATCPAATITGGNSVSVTGVTLKKPGDSCTYTLTIKNNGTFAATLTGISPATPSVTLGGTSASTVTGKILYKLTYDGKTVSDSTTGLTTALDTGASKTVIMEIVFDSSATAVPAEAVTVTIPETTFSYAAA